MKTSRILCGWVNVHGTSALPHELGAILPGAVNCTEMQTHAFCAGTVAVTEGAGTVAASAESGCVAALIGHPRWIPPAAADQACDQGHAATALARWELRGAAVLEEIAGSFSLVLWDPRRQRVLLAVDRIGIERLCFARAGNTVVFSTSAAAVAAHPMIAAPVSNQALYEYLYCHMVPSPDTIFAGVEKLQPAQQALITPTGLERCFYWNLHYPPVSTAPEADQKAEFKNLLRQGVARQIDERSVGAFLSGGTDSSTVAGILGDVSGRPTHTFSIGFEANGFDEIEYARITARHFGTVSHELYVTPEHVAEAMPMIAAAYDEPFGNASAVPTYFCARLARSHDIEVLLAGDGGDEFFGGNARYAKQGIFEHYWKLPRFARGILEASLLKLPQDVEPLLLRKIRSYVSQARVPLPDRLESYNFLHRTPLDTVFDPAFLTKVDVDRPLALMRDTYQRSTSAELVDRMMHLDHKFTLADNDLRKVTRMCEAAGVEVRFPFLDEDLITFSGTLTGRQKVAGNRLRVFFKEALSDYLPGETIAKSKHGFGLPFGLWLAQEGSLRDLANEALQSLAHRGIVRSDYLTQLRCAHQNEHASYYGVMIWILVQLELWLQRRA